LFGRCKLVAQEEIFNQRDRSYSAWHRSKSTGRYVGIENAQLLAMIDLDGALYVEYDNGSKDPLVLIEVAIDKGEARPYKNATVTTKLAEKAGIPCYVVLYTLSRNTNPADRNFRDIDSFRVKRTYPLPETGWRSFTPKQWAETLLKIRKRSANDVDMVLFGSDTGILELAA
jgi:hypothetical protein